MSNESQNALAPSVNPRTVPSGLLPNRLPVTWCKEHPSGKAVLTVERLGPTCALVWRPYAYYRAPHFEQFIFGDSLDFAENEATAIFVAEGLLLEPAPPHIRADAVEQRRADKAALAAGRKPGEIRKVGRPTATDEHKETMRLMREARKLQRRQSAKERGPFPWVNENGFKLDVCEDTEMDATPWCLMWFKNLNGFNNCDEDGWRWFATRSEATALAARWFEDGPRKEFVQECEHWNDPAPPVDPKREAQRLEEAHAFRARLRPYLVAAGKFSAAQLKEYDDSRASPAIVKWMLTPEGADAVRKSRESQFAA